MGQRLVRAKSKIRQAGIPFRLPERADLRERLAAVLDAIYAAFSEGWSDPAGTEIRRRNLAEEAIWLGRLVASLLPEEPEALGLLALMLHAEARRGARRNAARRIRAAGRAGPGSFGTRAMIEEAEALLFRASRMGAIGRYQLEAAVQSAHVVRRLTGRTDWAAIERLYDALAQIIDSPVVAINRAIAIAETRGPRGRARGARRARRRCAARRIPALLGGARRPAGRAGEIDAADAGLRAGDRARSRPGGAPTSCSTAARRCGAVAL